MVSDQQNRQNLRSAERLVALEMGVNPDDNSGLTYEQRSEFSRLLAAKIAQYPERFNDATRKTAGLVASRTFDPMGDPSFDWTDFASDLADNAIAAGDSVADVGRGVTAGFSTLKWLIPLAVVAAVVGYGWIQYKRASR